MYTSQGSDDGRPSSNNGVKLGGNEEGRPDNVNAKQKDGGTEYGRPDSVNRTGGTKGR